MSDVVTASFQELGLAPAVLKVIDEVGYESPSPIQARSIPPLLDGRDLLGQAQTGTGKTAAFALPLLSRIDLRQKQPQLLVMTPTRELALQVAEAMQTYARHLTGFQVLPVYGGQNMGQQLRQLARGVQAVVGTPGRIQDHMRRGTLRLDQVRAVVLDEADEMLKMGFVDEVEQILAETPPTRQTALFSATMPKEVLQIARKHLRDAVEIRIETKTSTVETINQRFWQVKGLHKLDALTRILEAEEVDGMIVFVRTKTATVELAERLEARGYACAALNGDMTQAMREKTVERLKAGSLDIVVATDVAARGLDVKRISHVVNYDIPYDTEAYVHRIGRTGRAGREGQAILFVAPRERRMLATIERATRQTIAPMSLPSRQAIADRRVGLFNDQITETLESQDLEFFEELIDQYQYEQNVGHRRIAAALAYLVQKEKPLQPPDLVEEELPVPEVESTRRPGSGPARGKGLSDDDLKRFRVEVGRSHGVEPKHLVGAITNEGRIHGQGIGQIRIFDEFSLVDLPADLPPQVLKHLQTVWVCGQQLQIHPDGEKPVGRKPFARRPPGKAGKPKPGPKPPYKKGKPKRGKK